MKNYTFLFFVVLILSALVSCSDDDEEDASDVSEMDYLDLTLASGSVIETDDSFLIQLDSDSTILKIDDEGYYSDLFDDGTRVIIYYWLIEEGAEDDDYDQYVGIYTMDEILTKSIFEFSNTTSQEDVDSIGEDPINIVDTWITDDYLNVQFEYYGYDQTHYVNLVYDENNPVTNDGDILLELKHNSNGDSEEDYYWGVIAFDISELQQSDTNVINIQLRALNEDNEFEYTNSISYSYSYGCDETSSSKGYFHGDYNINDRNPKRER